MARKKPQEPSMSLEGIHAGGNVSIHQGGSSDSNRRCCSALEDLPKRGGFTLFITVKSLYEECRGYCEVHCSKRNFWTWCLVGASVIYFAWLFMTRILANVDLPHQVKFVISAFHVAVAPFWLVSILTVLEAAFGRHQTLTVGYELLNWAKTSIPPRSGSPEPPEAILSRMTSRVERLRPDFFLGEKFIRRVFDHGRRKR